MQWVHKESVSHRFQEGVSRKAIQRIDDGQQLSVEDECRVLALFAAHSRCHSAADRTVPWSTS